MRALMSDHLNQIPPGDPFARPGDRRGGYPQLNGLTIRELYAVRLELSCRAASLIWALATRVRKESAPTPPTRSGPATFSAEASVIQVQIPSPQPLLL